MTELPAIAVVAGLLFDSSGRVLLAARPPGKAMAGRWEFPGGKVDAGESEPTALARELAEELGIEVREDHCEPFHAVTFQYPGAPRAVRIAAYRIRQYVGIPTGREGQALAWHPPAGLHEVDILEADRPIVTALRLGSPIDVSSLTTDAILYECIESIQRAPTPAHMVGVWLTDVAQALRARDAGADFVLLTPEAASQPNTPLRSSGVPWYTPISVSAPDATGRWTRTHSSVETSIST